MTHRDAGVEIVEFVVMAKRPVPGRVKTRLIASGFDAHAAAALAQAMLDCTVARLARRGPVVLALTPDGDGHETFAEGVRVVNQGDGDLGARLDRVWRLVGEDRRIAFFGADSPDVPDAALDAIGPALDDAELAVGPTEDGGYWTLAARRYAPPVLREIDWGGDSVYDQTRRRAEEAGLSLRPLPAWYDMDRATDVEALRRRLGALADSERTEALTRLRDALDALAEGR